MKSLHIRLRADKDIDEIFACIAADSKNAAWDFLDATEECFLMLRKRSGIGSRRWAHLPLLENLRFYPVKGFRNYLIFYFEHAKHIEILRVLHRARDLPYLLAEIES